CQRFSYIACLRAPTLRIGVAAWRVRGASPTLEAIVNRTQEYTMSSQAMSLAANATYELRFQSLFNEGRALAFPCDERGSVELDALSEQARNNYLYARAVVGVEFAVPAVRRRDLH